MNSITKKTITVLLIILAFFLFFKFFLRLFLPFLIAFVFATLFHKPIKSFSQRTGIKIRILSAVLVIGAVVVISFIIFWVSNRALNEAERFAISVSENSDRYVAAFFGFLDTVAEKIPFIEASGEDLSETVALSIRNMFSSWAARLPGVIARMIGMLPEILLFTVILIMASYYFCADYDEFVSKIRSLFPEKTLIYFSKFKKRLTDSGICYLKACLVLLIITYVELLIGFLMLDVQYAFTLALIIAAVDMLPILGVGTVLIPWTVWAWFTGDTYTAIGILIINLTVTVVRRFIEPRIIGSGIGLSPLTTLFAMYIGFRLFGFTGLFFSPLVAILIIHLLPDNVAERFGVKRNNA